MIETRVPMLLLILALVCIKAVLFAVDPTLRVYLGDSAAFLYGALDQGRLPDDRSFTYSLIIRAVVRPFEQLIVLGVWQSLAGVGVAIVMWWLLVRRFSVRPVLATAAACVLAVEPAQLYYERMVLAESLGLFAFVLFVGACCGYLASPRWWWLPAAAALGLAAATLRLNYLPVVLLMSLVLPLLPALERGRAARRQLAAHAAVAIIAVAILHGGYRYLVSGIFASPPGYLARAGFMQLGLVVPLVQPRHLERVGLPPDLGATLKYPLASPHARMRHMWTPGGLVWELRRREYNVESVARPLARMAIADNPLGVVRLGLHTVGDYFRPREIQHALDNDLGRRDIPEPILWSLREHWAYDARDLPTRVTIVSRAFELSTWWLVGCLLVLAPLAVVNLALSWRTPRRVDAALVAIISIGLVASHILFVPVAFYRYLHPLPFFVLLNSVPIAAYLAEARARRPRHIGSSALTGHFDSSLSTTAAVPAGTSAPRRRS